jgi:hypothetical protein
MMSDKPMEPHSFSIAVHRSHRTKKKPGPKQQTIIRPKSKANSAASIMICNRASVPRALQTINPSIQAEPQNVQSRESLITVPANAQFSSVQVTFTDATSYNAS